MNLPPTSPKSPISPTSPTNDVFDYPNTKQNETVSDVLKRMGYSNITKLTDTLQGSIWRATDQNKDVVIKTADRYLHHHSISNINGETSHSQENICVEQSILKFLTQNKNCPHSIVKYHRFFKTTNDFYFVMEYGGKSLFDFVKKAHKLIKDGRITIEHWKEVVGVICSQMVECIDYIHSKYVCHFDISLENFLINDVEVIVKKSLTKKKQQLTFMLDDIQIKLCDFGLADIFTNTRFTSSKFVGKELYASPEVMDNKKRFDARKNDIWCLGVCLFMVATGVAPFNSAQKTSKAFLYIMDKQMLDVLVSWDVLQFVDSDLFDLFEQIFEYESDRLNMKQIKQHSFLIKNE